MKQRSIRHSTLKKTWVRLATVTVYITNPEEYTIAVISRLQLIIFCVSFHRNATHIFLLTSSDIFFARKLFQLVNLILNR